MEVCSMCGKTISKVITTINTSKGYIEREFKLCDNCSTTVLDNMVKLQGFDTFKDYDEHRFEAAWEFSHYGEK